MLDLPIDASSSQALTMLKWYPLSYRRQFHRCSFVYKALNNNVDFNMEETKGNDLHCHVDFNMEETKGNDLHCQDH